jgi:hypothetical protein
LWSVGREMEGMSREPWSMHWAWGVCGVACGTEGGSGTGLSVWWAGVERGGEACGVERHVGHGVACGLGRGVKCGAWGTRVRIAYGMGRGLHGVRVASSVGYRGRGVRWA